MLIATSILKPRTPITQVHLQHPAITQVETNPCGTVAAGTCVLIIETFFAIHLRISYDSFLKTSRDIQISHDVILGSREPLHQ